MNEMNLRWLAASAGLPENEKTWNNEQLDRWVLIIHEYKEKLCIARLTDELHGLHRARSTWSPEADPKHTSRI